jgi:lambda family phage tail tape measure protein
MNSVLDSYVQSQVEHIKNSERLNDLANERNKIEQRIGEIQQQVDLGFINKAGGIREEINAQKALIGTLKARKKLVDDPTEVDSLIAAAQYKLLELQQNMKEQVGSGWEGFKQGVRDFTSDLYSNFQLWQRAAQDTASGMESAFETYFFDAMQGRFESFKDYFIGFLESIQKALSKLLAEQVTGQIVGGIAGAFSGGVGLSSQGGMVGSVPEGSFMTRPGGPILTAQRQYANGGWIKEPVFGVGLNSGESYSFAEKRPEYVNARPSGANVQVNVINQTGQPVEASQGKTRFDGKKFIVDVVMDDVNRGGRLRGLFGR